MKKKLMKKLSLNKSTVVSLENKEMKYARGGGFTYPRASCNTEDALCTHPAICGPDNTI